MAPKLWRESYSAKGMHALIDYHRSDILPSNVERLWVAVSINNIKTRASREMTSRKNISFFFDFNEVNVAKHWHGAGRGICHL